MNTFQPDFCNSLGSNCFQELPGGEKQFFLSFFFFKLSSFSELDKLFVRIAKKPPFLECLHILKRQLALALI